MTKNNLAESNDKESAQIEAYRQSWPKNNRVLMTYFAMALLPMIFVCFIIALTGKIYLTRLAHKIELSSAHNIPSMLWENKLYIVDAVSALVAGGLTVLTCLVLTRTKLDFQKYSFSKFVFFIVVDIVLFTIAIFVSIASVKQFC